MGVIEEVVAIKQELKEVKEENEKESIKRNKY